MYYIVIQESIRLTAILLNSTIKTIEQDKSSKIAIPIFFHDIIEVTTMASFLFV